VGEGEREEEREGDMLRGLSSQTKNAGYVPVTSMLTSLTKKKKKKEVYRRIKTRR